jgi:hypothetical protein
MYIYVITFKFDIAVLSNWISALLGLSSINSIEYMYNCFEQYVYIRGTGLSLVKEFTDECKHKHGGTFLACVQSFRDVRVTGNEGLGSDSPLFEISIPLLRDITLLQLYHSPAASIMAIVF